jgi:hypothetical protein
MKWRARTVGNILGRRVKKHGSSEPHVQILEHNYGPELR